ncbi:YidH family protein [Croceicoccus sp. Ery15]|uniref:YidH family protein n=1 Tax=Croceicoccus sp. Ery15 TaxID=1703338 RepID=UPI001E501FD5|nr:DUF202 domain-containing protein [Croceicoccus sp. Ery15]
MSEPTPPVPRSVSDPVPDLPVIAEDQKGEASTIYSHYRSGLSRHRTQMSDHRTDLSENRTEMSMRRTGMSIHRTRMSADRTMMSEIRTALSLIGFGFTLYEAFRSLDKSGMLENSPSPRNFGLILILLGVAILLGGIWRHVQFAQELRRTRKTMMAEGLVHGESTYPISISLVVSIGLMLVGMAAAANIIFGISLFG